MCTICRIQLSSTSHPNVTCPIPHLKKNMIKWKNHIHKCHDQVCARKKSATKSAQSNENAWNWQIRIYGKTCLLILKVSCNHYKLCAWAAFACKQCTISLTNNLLEYVRRALMSICNHGKRRKIKYSTTNGNSCKSHEKSSAINKKWKRTKPNNGNIKFIVAVLLAS